LKILANMSLSGIVTLRTVVHLYIQFKEGSVLSGVNVSLLQPCTRHLLSWCGETYFKIDTVNK